VSKAPEHCDWEERLQNWIDGDLHPAQFAAVAEHIASCTSCHARMNRLRAVDAALSGSFSQATLDESFDRKVFERIASAAKTDRVAARARIEREWQDQIAALSDQWRDVWKVIILNAVAGVAVLIALTTAFSVLPSVSHLIDRMLLLTQYGSVRPAITLSTAAGLTVVALLLVRSLASTER
jgi:anti-sigma factor RsiW